LALLSKFYFNAENKNAGQIIMPGSVAMKRH
jgi:hypothetical protein